MSAQIISPAALVALKDALANIYWYKKDLRSFLTYTLDNNAIVSTFDWESITKYENVSLLIDRMNSRYDMYRVDLLNLLRAVCDFDDYSHLNRLDNAADKIEKAKSSVTALRKHCKGYFDQLDELENQKVRKEKYELHMREAQELKDKMEGFKQRYYQLALLENAQKRGYLGVSA